MSTQYVLILGVDRQADDVDYGDDRVALVETDLWPSWSEAHVAGLRALGQTGVSAVAQLAADGVGSHEYDTTLERDGERIIVGFTIEPYYDEPGGEGFTGEYFTHTNLRRAESDAAPLLRAIAASELIDMRLEDVEIRWSDDSAKQDPELICPRCDEAICDVEHGDSLGLLARTVLGHLNEECKKT